MTANTAPERQWNTWHHRYPSCFLHLPSGFAVRVCAYSSQADHYTDFAVTDSQAEAVLGPHAADGSYVQLDLIHAGTRIRVEYAKREWNELVARIRIVEQGELLFRNQLIVEAGFLQPGTPADADAQLTLDLPDEEHTYLTPTTAHAAWRSQQFCLELSAQPVAVAAYSDAAAVGRAAQEDDWPRRPPTAAHGAAWTAFRFTGDKRAELVLAVAHVTDLGWGRRLASDLVGAADDIIEARARASVQPDRAVAAVRDVMAWNTVADAVNARTYTCLSRRWIDGLGGWTIWLTDVLYNALLNARAADWQMARDNLEAVLAGQQPAGNLPCLMAGSQEWVDRTQLPIAIYITWRVYLLTGDRTLIDRWYPALCRHYAWWFSHRDGNGNGLLEYGSSPTGRAPYAHTKQAAVNESGMDNMPVFDDAEFDSAAHTLSYEEVASNSLLVLEGQMLSRMAAELGHEDHARRWQSQADVLAQKVRDALWDPERRLFSGRFWSGSFARQIAPTIFFPLAAGIATAEQADALVSEHLLNKAEFWSDLPLPSTPFSDPIAKENDYWRGRVWPPLNFFTWEGLRRYGYGDIARELADRSWKMFIAEWESRRHCHENYHISDPKLHESPDSDVFYSWGALMPLMTALEYADVSPWDGLTLCAGESQDAVLALPGNLLRARRDGDGVTVSVNNTDRWHVTPHARLRHVAITDGRIAFRVPPAAHGYQVRLHGLTRRELVRCLASGEPVVPTTSDDGMLVTIPGSETDTDVDILIDESAEG